MEAIQNNGGGEPAEAILQFFAFDHLPPQLQAMSKLFHDLAAEVVRVAPRSAERTVALRKILEGKDAAVRAMLCAPTPWSSRASGPVDVGG